MEMFALDPVVTTGPEGTRLLLACDKVEGSLSVFMVFIEAGFGLVPALAPPRLLTRSLIAGKVMHARQAEKSLPPLNSWQTAGINLYFIMVYAVCDLNPYHLDSLLSTSLPPLPRPSYLPTSS
eukprot:765376-Hanusia_phi.AAC.8